MNFRAKTLLVGAFGVITILTIGAGFYFFNFKPRKDFRSHVSGKLSTLKAIISANSVSPDELNRYGMFVLSDLHKSENHLSAIEKSHLRSIIHLISGFETFTILYKEFGSPIQLGPTTRSLIEPYIDTLAGTQDFYTSPSLESYRFAAKEVQRTRFKIEQARSNTEKANLQIWLSAQESVLQSPPPLPSKDFINPKIAAASILSQIDDLIDDIHDQLSETPLLAHEPRPEP